MQLQTTTATTRRWHILIIWSSFLLIVNYGQKMHEMDAEEASTELTATAMDEGALAALPKPQDERVNFNLNAASEEQRNISAEAMKAIASAENETDLVEAVAMLNMTSESGRFLLSAILQYLNITAAAATATTTTAASTPTATNTVTYNYVLVPSPAYSYSYPYYGGGYGGYGGYGGGYGGYGFGPYGYYG